MQDEARRALEAIIMVADQPADPALLAQLVELSPVAVEEILEEVASSYEAEGRGFRLVKVAGGWRYQSHEDCEAYVERYVLTGQSARLSAAALETLAIVAYKQPISRAQVAAIRGVNVDGVIRTLQQRGYIDETGRDAGPGQASLFGTTQLFLERLGINSVEDLPSLGDFIPGADVVERLEHGLRFDENEDSGTGDEAATAASATDGQTNSAGDDATTSADADAAVSEDHADGASPSEETATDPDDESTEPTVDLAGIEERGSIVDLEDETD
ncbi:MAG: SMC-Scp complex subunit ScpB [Microthrixaceae bacterium]